MADTPNPIETQKYLSGMDYPVSKQTIVDTAKQQGAPDDIVEALSKISDQEYHGPNAISHELSVDH